MRRVTQNVHANAQTRNGERAQTRRDKGSRKTDAKELGVVSKAELGLLDLRGDGKNVRHTVRGTAACGGLSYVMTERDEAKKKWGKKRGKTKREETNGQSISQEILGFLKGFFEEKQ